MHRLGITALALTVVTTLGGVTAASGATGGHTYPSRDRVRQAQHRAVGAAAHLAGIRAELVVADQRLQDAAITAEQAAERFNGARWQLQQARRDSRVAERHARIAAADVSHQRSAYAATVVSSYELGPSLSSLSALTDSDGIDAVVQKLTTLQNAQSAMDGKYDSYLASSTLAGVASDQADSARATAQAMAVKARSARAAAAAAEAAAGRTTQAIAHRKTRLIHRIARLQHISVALAEQRQAGLEAAAQQAAAQAAQQAAQQQQQSQATQAPTQQPTQQPTSQPTQQPTSQPTQQPTQQPTSGPTSGPTAAPTSVPTPEPTEPTNPPSTPPTAPPTPASGAAAAIAFARQQIGDPYRWGATGPDAWDCSGLTRGAWQAGGIDLPHYSVAQYTESTPISVSQLQPGDLVFWGSSSQASSIYHVALYVGNGQIIQAPRTGENVQQVSMYYWIMPNFFARP